MFAPSAHSLNMNVKTDSSRRVEELAHNAISPAGRGRFEAVGGPHDVGLALAILAILTMWLTYLLDTLPGQRFQWL